MNIGSVHNQARRGYAQARSSSAFETLTRVGFLSKGVVYLLIGVLAVMAAFREGGQTTDQQGAIREIASKPFGEFALIVIGVGLLAYALWRLVNAIEDSEHNGKSGKGLAKRAGYVFAAITYTGIAVSALKLAIGEASRGGDATRTWTARLMDAPAGTFLVMLAGIAVIAAGIYQINHGWKEKFRKHLETTGNDWLIPTGKWGYVARGIVFMITGGFIVSAGLQHDASQARGLEGALDTLAAQPFGQWLLALVAAGLACYGVFSILSAKYRRVAT